ncbi:MAG TPA: hypothetical protein VKY53_07785 [Marinobacter sp.]|nr:hypothetical protein [Marinobacter sp.]
MTRAKYSPPGWHPDEVAFLDRHKVISEQAPLSAAVRVKERWIHNTLREVFLTSNGYVLKRYSHFPGRKDYRKVWHREHTALARLSGLPVPRSLGFVSVVHQPGTTSVLHLRTLLAGAPVQWAPTEDMQRLAQLLSAFHKRMVVTLDPQQENFIRLDQTTGELGFIDLGRARVFNGFTPLMLVNVGKELARLSIEGGLSAQQFQSFMQHYLREAAFSTVQHRIVRSSLRYWLKRHARKQRKKAGN